ncbi:MAG: dTDP-glucose 4,6-dehydratase [Thermoguttaceae bacterium]|nr:dTDP-glucose 4,6-dehydratase [Thermoguttaceae bacterium]
MGRIGRKKRPFKIVMIVRKTMYDKTVLITGGAGFIGANFVPFFVEKYPQYRVIVLDKLTYAGNKDHLNKCLNRENYLFIQGDIIDRPAVEKIFRQEHITDVIHFAAESHVDHSITGPQAFIETNLLGTFTLLDLARLYWLDGPNKTRPGFERSRFHHISTDEVYGTLGPEGFFYETTPYAPNSPYSASKAGSDFLVRAWHHTYGMNVTTSNCSNNYGPKQHPEKLIPKIVANAMANIPIPIYGDGGNVRDWLYVLDHCRAIDLIFHHGRSGETYNVGGHNEKSNIEIAQTICKILDQKRPCKTGSYARLLAFVEDRAGHDRRYAIDATKIQSELGWRPQENFESGIVKTIDWLLSTMSPVQ